MRYYKIVISDPTSGAAIQTFSSLNADGTTNPRALDAMIDIPVANYATPMGGSFVRLWGIPLQQISQASDLNNKAVAIYGGMAKGLPLANPAQAGLLARGTIFPAFGNWVDTAQTLDLLLAPAAGSNASPSNIVHNWPRGVGLGQAIESTLKTAFPLFKTQVNVGANLVLQQDDFGFYSTIGQYATYLKALSRRINADPKYAGVNVSVQGDLITVYDGTSPIGTAKQIAFQDMIGQPTWLGLNTVQAKLVMRGDITIGQEIKMPPVLTTTSASSFSQFRNKSAFQGSFIVQSLHHVGTFRQEDANSWVSVIDAVTKT